MRTFVTKENSLNVGEFAARIEQGSSAATSRTTRELGARGVHRGPSPHLGGRGRRD
jgi:hypothetical protein